ncbi:MAG: hypothetical protein M3416_16835 [Acidobacteriota bacterium]|nr:hypothetical protein [Acidobacteriota bacterium]
MRLPSVSLAFAVGALIHAAPAAAVARAAAHEPVLATRCMDLSDLKTVEEVPLPPPVAAARPAPVPTPLDARRLAVEDSYKDVFGILSEENECSRFFGGPAKAVEAFNQFARRLSSSPLGDPRVAVRMSGAFTYYQNHETGASYRLFDRATINRDGPLGPQVSLTWAARMQVGRYPAHTPQARALVLLHELGHLVRGPGGGWLLPNDGDDYLLSSRNTQEVEAHCLEQLKAIRD